MALSINEIKSGVTILVENEVYMCIDAQHVKPGKGAAFVRARFRGKALERDSPQRLVAKKSVVQAEAFRPKEFLFSKNQDEILAKLWATTLVE